MLHPAVTFVTGTPAATCPAALVRFHERVYHSARSRPPPTDTMLINLLPDFLAVADSADPVAAYDRYLAAHAGLLRAYWQNYVVEPEGPLFREIVRTAALAPRGDLRTLLAHTDLIALARHAEERCTELFAPDVDFDIVLMVGVGAANAGELVVNGRGVAFVALEHFTGVANPATRALGLDPELIPMWLAHEIAHVVRYTSSASRSALRTLVAAAGGNYSYWDTGRRAPLGELVVNEGLAVQASRLVSPGHAAWEYFGYSRREFAQARELAPVAHRAIAADLGRAGLGLRLKYLSGGMSEQARTVERTVLPERAGYLVGAQLVDDAVRERGIAWALRASAEELLEVSASSAARSA